MKQFLCNRLRLCNYLIDRGFTPSQVLPDSQNPKFNVFLFDETPELSAAVVQYLSVDCMTARKKAERKSNHERTKEEK